jgi:glycerol uptake facilitator-like aquaporin
MCVVTSISKQMMGTSRWYSRFAVELLSSMGFQVIGAAGGTPVANGLALVCAVLFAAKTSQAILNPALSLTYCLTGHIRPTDMLLYSAAQVAGCILGCLWLTVLVPGASVRGPISAPIAFDVGCFVPNPSLSSAAVLAWEFTGSLVFFVTVLVVVNYSLLKKGYGNVGPIVIGIALTACASALQGRTGGAMNPARTLAPWIVAGCGPQAPGGTIGLYIAGQYIAAVVAAMFVVPWYGFAAHSWLRNLLPYDIASRSYNPRLL